MFHAARALLSRRGFKPKSHRGVQSLFGLHVIQTGMMDARFARMLGRAADLREQSDYEVTLPMTDADMGRSLVEAAEFLAEIKRIMSQLDN